MIASIFELSKEDLKDPRALLSIYSHFDSEALISSKEDMENWFDQCKKKDVKVFVVKVMIPKPGDATSFETHLAGAVTLIIEPKLIHGLCYVGHIEDVVVLERFRGHKLGKSLVGYAKQYAKDRGCYKVILNCGLETKGFYESNGFLPSGEIQMKSSPTMVNSRALPST